LGQQKAVFDHVTFFRVNTLQQTGLERKWAMAIVAFFLLDNFL